MELLIRLCEDPTIEFVQRNGRLFLLFLEPCSSDVALYRWNLGSAIGQPVGACNLLTTFYGYK
jgi:hypothetical protein